MVTGRWGLVTFIGGVGLFVAIGVWVIWPAARGHVNLPGAPHRHVTSTPKPTLTPTPTLTLTPNPARTVVRVLPGEPAPRETVTSRSTVTRSPGARPSPTATPSRSPSPGPTPPVCVVVLGRLICA